MRVAKLKGAQGLAWISAGWRLFRLQPVNYATLLATYIFALMLTMLATDVLERWCASVIPAGAAALIAEAANFLLLALTPGLSIGFIAASQTALRGAPVYPTLLIRAFRIDRRTTLSLIGLGLIQFGLILVLTAVVVTSPSLDGAVDASGKFDLSKVPPDEAFKFLIAQILKILVTLPVYLAVWYAPVLIAWHRMSVYKAVFFSAAAVWRNRWAFLTYGCGWLAAWLVALSIAGLLLSVLGLGNSGFIVGIPLMLISGCVFYCSIYPSYSTVFVDDGADLGASAT